MIGSPLEKRLLFPRSTLRERVGRGVGQRAIRVVSDLPYPGGESSWQPEPVYASAFT